MLDQGDRTDPGGVLEAGQDHREILSHPEHRAVPQRNLDVQLSAERLFPKRFRSDEAACHAKVLVDANGAVPASTTPSSSALTPAQLQSAYKLTGLSSGGKTVAIVDAYGYGNLARDLATYRSYFGLPACTTASGWVVQANSTSFADLGTAVNTAAKQAGVVAISNSYGSSADAADSSYGSYYNHPGIAVTASTGDNGYLGGSFPASSTYAVAVGGTTLKAASGTTRGWAESVWSGAGSGCSTYNAKPSWQTSVTGCAKRAMADVAAAADPSAGGMAVYYPTNTTQSTWAQVGGTSEASPIIAATYALGTKTLPSYPAALPWANSGSLNDVTTGSNGSCSPAVWCTGTAGWDGPTGLGTPNGAGAF